MQQIIKIGTHNTTLAFWQANRVRKQLEELGYTSEIVSVDASEDLNDELQKKTFDVAVHSLKDVTTFLPEKVKQIAVLKRANYSDILLLRDNEEFFGQPEATIGVSNPLAKTQWKLMYPTHTVIDFSGSIEERLEIFNASDWDGAVFGAADLERLGLREKGAINLTWMLPAPGKGATMLAVLEDNDFAIDACEQLNHRESELCVNIERDFLDRLETTKEDAVGALAYVDERTEEINFKAVLLNREGTRKLTVTKNAPVDRHRYLAKDCADYIINKEGKELLKVKETLVTDFSVYATQKLSEMQKDNFLPSIEVSDSDFIKIRFNRIAPKKVKNQLENVVFTTKNGVEAVLNSFTSDELNFKNIYCIGRRTKRFIEKNIGKVVHVERNQEKLENYLSKELKGKTITHFCSDVEIASENNFATQQIEAYKILFSPSKIADATDGVLFYTALTVQSYLEQNEASRIAFCIGESTAKEARKSFKTVKVANLPTVESLIELVNLHFESVK